MDITAFSHTAFRHVLITDTRQIRDALCWTYPNLTERDYSNIIIKAGYDLNVLHTRESKLVIESIPNLELITHLAKAVEPFVYALFKDVMRWTLTDPPDGGFAVFNGERFWLCWS